MPTRNVVHNSHLADLVERLVASGRYQDASEGLRLVESREAEDIARLHALCARPPGSGSPTLAVHAFEALNRPPRSPTI